MKFVDARHFYRGRRSPRVRVIVVHSMEIPEKGDTAEACANYFARTDKKASAHYCVDNNSEVQCVRDTDTAFHAPGCNHDGIGIEHAGYARQTPTEWADEYSKAMLERSARLAAILCRRWDIPAVWLDDRALERGDAGITDHWTVTRVYQRSTHTDPGPHFPRASYIARIRELLGDDELTPDEKNMLARIHHEVVVGEKGDDAATVAQKLDQIIRRLDKIEARIK